MPDRFYDFWNYPDWINEMHAKYRDLADSYKQAIEHLLHKEENSHNTFSERDIMPILSLISHYIELMLKSIILKSDQEFPKNHKLTNLIRVIKTINPSFNISECSQKFIQILTNLDPKGYAFRYPTNKNMIENFVTRNINLAKGIRLSYVSISFRSIVDDMEKNYS